MNHQKFMEAHPDFAQLVLTHGWEGAEVAVRGKADATSKGIAADLDAARITDKGEASARNTEMTKRLGLSYDDAQAMIGQLEKERDLHDWLESRINRTRAEGRKLEHDE